MAKRKGMIKKYKKGWLGAAVAEDGDRLSEDAALEAALWVEEGHSHVHCAAAGCACRYDHSPLYVHEAAFNSAVSENWLCGDEVKKVKLHTFIVRSVR